MYSQAEILSEFAWHVYSPWDQMVEIAHRRRSLAKLWSYNKWLEKKDHYTKRLAYMRKYNALQSTKDRRNKSRPLKGRFLVTPELARSCMAEFQSTGGSMASFARLKGIKYQTMVDILKGKHV